MSFQSRSMGKLVGWSAFAASCLAGCGPAEVSDGEGATDAVDVPDVASAEQAVIPGATVTRISTLRTIQPGATVTVTNNCPAGSVVVGGGFIAANPRVWVNASRAIGNGWQIIATNRNDAHPRSINTEAECLTGTNATQVQASSLGGSLAGFGGSRCDIVTCPTGSFAVSGGWRTDLGGSAYMSRPTSDGRSWETCAMNHNPLQAIGFTANATCLKGVTGATQTTFLSATIPPDQTARIDSGHCGAGLLLGSGAFNLVSGNIRGFLSASNRSFQDPTQWQTQVLNPSSGTSIVVRASNTCLNLWP